MINDFTVWATPLSETTKFEELSGATIAIDASWFINLYLSEPPYKEPLLSALGGVPFALKDHVTKCLSALAESNITPIFIFHGLNVSDEYQPFEKSSEVAQKMTEAWDLYNAHQAISAVEAFGDTGYSQPEDYCRFFQTILTARNIKFIVAPYKAWSQSSYLHTLGDEYIDAVAGPSEILLFQVDKLITSIDSKNKEITFFRRELCLQEMGGQDYESFVDAAILSGSSLLPAVPMLRDNRRPDRIRQAYNMMKGAGQTGVSVCLNAQEDPTMKRLNYLDRYRKTRLAVKHAVIMKSDGSVVSFDAENMPNDSQEFLGPRLPEELYYYLSVGVIGPRPINRLSLGKLFELEPGDGGDSTEYKQLVQEKLRPLHAITLSLLSKPLSRGFQYRDIKLSCWFDQAAEATIKFSEGPDPLNMVSKWHVRQDTLKSNSRLAADDLTIASFVQSLNDPSFAAKTLVAKDRSKPLETKAEVQANAFWRFLHIRGYLDDEHRLTPWGNVLDSMLSNLQNQGRDWYEAVFTATELLRFNLLTSTNYFPSYSGAPLGGTDVDKRNTMLVSRVACVGRIQHQDIGFTGPLSRNLRGYGSMVNAVRSSNRDLLETSLATLLLFGDADRVKVMSDLTSISLELPFLLPTDCALGIIVKAYLDELFSAQEGSGLSDPVRKAEVRKRTAAFVPYSRGFDDNLDRAFAFWDAVYAGVKVSRQLGLVKDAAQWDEADAWLKEKR